MKQALKVSVEKLGRALEEFPWSDANAYGNWLAQTYYYVRHSTRLLAASAARMPFSEQGDALHQRFATHMGEEKRHELLALHDLRALGKALDSFPELAATRLLYEPQYAKVEYQDPLALFGYILALEAMSATHGKRHLELAQQAHGRGAVTFLRVHADDDVEHVDKALAVLNALDETRIKAVETNLDQTTFAYILLLSEARRVP